MIFRARTRTDDELVTKNTRIMDSSVKGDVFTLKHAENVSGIIESANNDRLYGNNGWTKDKTMRKIATLPASILLKYPHLIKDKKALKKWLQTPEGMLFRTTEGGI